MGYIASIIVELICDDPDHPVEKSADGAVVPHAKYEGTTIGECFQAARDEGWTIWTRHKVDRPGTERGHCLCPKHIVKR